jgi:hypothetical protein
MMIITQTDMDPVLIRKFFVSTPIAKNFAEWPLVSTNPNFSKNDEISKISRFAASVIYPR